LEHYPDSLVEFIHEQPPGMKMLLRSGNKSSPGMFEQVMAKLATSLWMDVEWVRPDEGLGRAGTFLRDVELARKADLVLCYFDTIEISGGTAHIVEKAMDQEVPVYAYGFDGSTFQRIGELDPQNRWGKRVP